MAAAAMMWTIPGFLTLFDRNERLGHAASVPLITTCSLHSIDATDMRYNESLFDLTDWLTDPPEGGPVQMWVVGVGLSAAITLYGLSCCLTQRATTLNITMRGFSAVRRGLWLEITGIHAVTFGLVVICIGLFVHFQWFWGNHSRLSRLHEVPKYSTAFAAAAATVVHAFMMITRT